MTADTTSRRHLLLMLAAGAGLGGCAQLATNLGLAPLLQRLGLMEAPAPALPAAEAAALRALDVQGGRALLAGDVEGAIAAWSRYAQQAPSTLPRARQLRGHLTLLRREAARRFVQRATAAEAATGLRRTDRLHVAVLPFANAVPSPSTNASASASANTSPSPAAPAPAAGFNRAIVAMIAVDLARVPGLTVLEREKVELLTAELRLSASALVDPATAARPGRLLGAGTVVGGEVLNAPGPTGPGSGRYRLSTAVGDVSRGRLLGQAEIEGLQSEFFVLQKRIVHGILDLLDVPNRPAAVDVVHTRSWEAYARFARGLQLLSEDKFTEAREAFVAALGFDPAFAMAEEAFLATPERPATLQEMAAAAPAA
jgi:TolB-like protein